MNLSTWLNEFDLDLKLYLQAKYIHSKHKIPATQQSKFEKKLFSSDTLLNLMSDEEMLSNINLIMKKAPNSNLALSSARSLLVAIQPAIAETERTNSDIVKTAQIYKEFTFKIADIVNDLYHKNNNSRLLSIMQKHAVRLAEVTGVLIMVECTYKNMPDKNISDQIIMKADAVTNKMRAEVNVISAKNNVSSQPVEISTWAETLKKDLRMNLQYLYIESNRAFFSSVKKLDGSGLNLFSDSTLMKDILANEAFDKLFVSDAEKKIVKDIYISLEHLPLNLSGAQDELLLQQLYLSLAVNCEELEKINKSNPFLNTLQNAGIELAEIAKLKPNPSFKITSAENSTTNRQKISDKVGQFTQAHEKELYEYKESDGANKSAVSPAKKIF